MADSIPRVAVFHGGDAIGRRVASDEFVRSIRAMHSDVADERFDSSSEKFEYFLERIITPSLFQSVRIFYVRHANALADNDLTHLARAMGYDVPDAYLVVDIDDGLKKDALNKLLKKLGTKGLEKAGKCMVHEFAKPPDYKVADWLAERALSVFGRSLSKADAEYLVDLVGTELEILYSELQKIDINLPPKAAVTRASIEATTGATRTMNSFELAAALSAKDLGRTMEVVDSLFSSAFYAPPIVASLFRHFWAIRRIRAYGRNNPDTVKRYLGSRQYKVKNELAFEIGVASGLLRSNDTPGRAYPVVVKSGIVEQARAFSNPQLQTVFRLLRDFDVGVKTGRVSPTRDVFLLLCYQIARVAELEREERRP